MKLTASVPLPGDGEVLSKAVQAQLSRVLASELFKPSVQHQLLLTTIVNESLAERPDALKEVILGKEVLGRADYDPTRHTQVRVAVNSVRRKLAKYYEAAGTEDLIQIEIPRGHYVAVFSALPATLAKPSQSRRYLVLLACGAALLIVAALWAIRRSAPEPVGVASQITFDTGWTAQPAVSRDGAVLVYSSDRGPRGYSDIWIRQGNGDLRQLTNDPAHDMTPDISPDGTQVVFRSWRKEEGIWSMSAKGGPAKLLAKQGYSPRFSSDGKRVAFSGLGMDDTLHIFTIPADGGLPERVDSGVEEVGCPVWSPDGNEIAFVARGENGGGFDLWTAKARGPRDQRSRGLGIQAKLRAQKLPPIYSEADCPQDWIDNRLLFVTHQRETGSLFQISLDPSGSLGQIEAVPSAIGTESARAIRGHGGRVSILFAIERTQTNIWATNLAGSAPLEQLTHDGSLTSGVKGAWPALSGDGKVLAFITERSGSPDICLKDLRSGVERLLAASPFWQGPLFLDQNGARLVFVRKQGSTVSVILRDVAEKKDRLVTTDCPVLQDWSRDGKMLLCADGSNVFGHRLSPSGEVPLLHLLHAPVWARFSPDHRWISFAAATGQGDTYAGFIAPLDGSGRTIQVCQGPYGLSLHWASNGNAVYFWDFRDGFRCLYMQPLDPQTKVPEGKAVAVLHRHALQSYPWAGGTLAIGLGRMAMTLKDRLANIWKVDLPH